MKKVLVIALLVLMVSSVLFAGGGRQQQTAEGGLAVLRTGTIPAFNSVATKYIIDQGMDVKAGLKLEPISFPTGAPMAEALGADLLDVGIMSGAAITAISAYDCFIIGEVNGGAGGIGLWVRPDSPILSVKGVNPRFPDLYGNIDLLRGKQVLLPIGTWAQWIILSWLEAVGGKPEDVEIVHMDFAPAHQAYLAGHGDIVAQNPPMSFRAMEQGWINAASMDALFLPLTDSVVVNPKTFNNPDKRWALEKFLELQFDANEILNADKALAEDRLAAWYRDNGASVTAVDVAFEVAAKKFFTREEARSTLVLGAAAKQMAEFMAFAGTLEADRLPKFTSNVRSEIWNAVINR